MKADWSLKIYFIRIFFLFVLFAVELPTSYHNCHHPSAILVWVLWGFWHRRDDVFSQSHFVLCLCQSLVETRSQMKVFELRKEVGCGDRMASQITIMIRVLIMSELYNVKKSFASLQRNYSSVVHKDNQPCIFLWRSHLDPELQTV